MKIPLFSLSLTSPAFGWYTSLAPGSITSWKQLEEQFHAQFFSGSDEAMLSNLIALRQRTGETMRQYIQRFRKARNRCYSLYLSERNLAELAYGGLSRVTKGIYGPTDFDSIGHLMSKVSSYECLHPDLYAEKPWRPVAYFQASEEESADEAEVAVV